MQAQPSGKFRHVVFAGAINAGRPLNLAPQVTDDEGSDRALLEPQTAAFVRQLFEQAGLDSRDYRPETLRRRLPACLRALHVRSIEQADAALRHNPRLAPVALECLLIGVSWFFRDDTVFDALRKHVLPEFANSARRLRIWSVGCSNGAELYSVTILLAEAGLLEKLDLLGTDCRPDAIAAARSASYDPPSVAHVPEDLLRRYFANRFDRCELRRDLAGAVRWRCADALNVLEPGGWDMILCRNLAMYLNAAPAAELWARLASQSLPGGWLITGKAERPGSAPRLRNVAPCIYRREK